MLLFLFFIIINIFFNLFCVQCFTCLIFCITFVRVTAFLIILLSLLASAFVFALYLNSAKLLLVLSADFSVWLMLFYVLIICLHFVSLVDCGGFARASLFCVVFLLTLAPLLMICVVVGLRRILCVL